VTDRARAHAQVTPEQLRCPLPGCARPLAPGEARSCLAGDAGARARYDAFTLKGYLARRAGSAFLCPTPGCEFAAELDAPPAAAGDDDPALLGLGGVGGSGGGGGLLDRPFRCPCCRARFCLRCRRRWHGRLTCADAAAAADAADAAARAAAPGRRGGTPAGGRWGGGGGPSRRLSTEAARGRESTPPTAREPQPTSGRGPCGPAAGQRRGGMGPLAGSLAPAPGLAGPAPAWLAGETRAGAAKTRAGRRWLGIDNGSDAAG
jgi:hypothetical protein